MNYQKLRTQLLKALRGRRSQSQMSQKMGYSFNKVNRWESGKTEISWGEFTEFCNKVKCPLGKALKVYGYHAAAEDTVLLLKHFKVETQKTLWTKSLNITRFKLSRWLKGENEPSLSEMMKIMATATTEFFLFLDTLGVAHEVPILENKLKDYKEERKLHAQIPWLSALLCGLDSPEYKNLKEHDDEVLAIASRLSVSRTKSSLQKAKAQGVIDYTDNVYRTKNLVMNTSHSFEALRNIHLYWNNRAKDFVTQSFPTKGSFVAYQVFNLNSEAMGKIRECYGRFYNEIASIVEDNNSVGDKSYFLGTQFLDFMDLPQEEEPKKGSHK